MKMNADEPEIEALEVPSQDGQSEGGKSAEQMKMSRLERLKKKIKKFQRKEPDIYPLW